MLSETKPKQIEGKKKSVWWVKWEKKIILFGPIIILFGPVIILFGLVIIYLDRYLFTWAYLVYLGFELLSGETRYNSVSPISLLK